MSQAPAMPMYWDAYLADTTHLSAEEHGAYMLLMAAMWRRNGYVPDNDVDNARILKVTKAKWKKIKTRLDPFLEYTEHGVGSLHLREWGKPKNRPSLSKYVMEEVRQRDGNCCVYCGDFDGPFEFDHIYPWSRGGSDDVDNLAISCGPCNRKKGAKTLEEMGWSLSLSEVGDGK